MAPHTHALQPAVRMASAEQQQPPRHICVAHSKRLMQASPAERCRQEPEKATHARQPERAAFALQQKPPRQAGATPGYGSAQSTSVEQAEPDTRTVRDGDGEQLAVRVNVDENVMLPVTLAVSVMLPVRLDVIEAELVLDAVVDDDDDHVAVIEADGVVDVDVDGDGGVFW